MTDDQKMCNHKWRKAYGGYCSECYLTRKEEREWLKEIQTMPDLAPKPISLRELSKGIHSTKALRQFTEMQKKERDKRVRLTEQELGMMPLESVDRYVREYLIPVPKSTPKFEGN